MMAFRCLPFLSQIAHRRQQGVGQDFEKNMVLRIESPAPPIKVNGWLRGKPLTNLSTRQGVPY
ncbi:hypothetical protein MES4922_10246 [Mesorhizobium ventifaucium]|uniref:Uncharacterized protein n=1 Tax=Mesorhizobium ventifaucium TaxID=666020 RepID=A0ABN8J8Y4_9HYPH|nr:hypothetical protein MES4922_10246 [Mesorhizobium ventifaucium]